MNKAYKMLEEFRKNTIKEIRREFQRPKSMKMINDINNELIPILEELNTQDTDSTK